MATLDEDSAEEDELSCSVSTADKPAPLFNFGTTTLKFWSKGEPVKELQRFLNYVSLWTMEVKIEDWKFKKF